MKIEKAIKVLQLDLTENAYVPGSDFENALKMGIDALRRIEATRLVRNTGTIVLLPGESES